MRKEKLLDICDVYQPKTISTKQFISDGNYTVYGANGAIGKYDKFNHEESEVLMACRGATCGAINVSEPYSWINGNAMVIHPKEPCILDKKYLMYHLVFSKKDSIISGTAQPQITRQNMRDFTINVCDYVEQKRIVSRIEELFSQLDVGMETLIKTKEQVNAYRQSVLKEAFKTFEKKTPIKDVSEIVTSGSRGWAKYYSDSGARFVRITDMDREGIHLKNDSIQYVSLPDIIEGKRSRLKPNDVLVSITADLGSIALIPQDIPEAYINQHIAMVRFSNADQGEFMAWYLKSDYGQKELIKNRRGAGKLGLGLDDIRGTVVPIVADDIAFHTVSKIHSKMSVCDNIEKTVTDSMRQSDALRQSILKEAFEGRL